MFCAISGVCLNLLQQRLLKKKKFSFSGKIIIKITFIFISISDDEVFFRFDKDREKNTDKRTHTLTTENTHKNIRTDIHTDQKGT